MMWPLRLQSFRFQTKNQAIMICEDKCYAWDEERMLEELMNGAPSPGLGCACREGLLEEAR